MKMMMIPISVSLALLATSPAWACGFCAGDRAASVYSFKNKKFAEVHQANYVSVELQGPRSQGSQNDFEVAVAALRELNGVYSETVISAFAQRAVSFVYRGDSKLDEIAQAFARQRAGWSLKLIEQVQ